MKTKFEEHVTGANPVITYVLSSHLWLEHLLIRSLFTVIPEPNVLLGRNLTFSFLVSLAEAHMIIKPDFALVLRRVNALRNKFAHQLSFEPNDSEISELQKALRDMERPFLISTVTPSEHEMTIALGSICGFMETRARELGATEI
jgi:hypothetical protein